MSLGPDFEAKLAELRVSFVAQLRTQQARLDEIAAQLSAAVGPATELERVRLRDLAHRLAGNGALYGLPQVSEWGKRTERLCWTQAPVEELLAAIREFAKLLASVDVRRVA